MIRIYMKPDCVVVELKPSGILCSSEINIELGGDANMPALAREIDWDNEESDW